MDQAHAEPEALARFLDGRLESPARARLAEHLAECASCRADLVHAGRVLKGSGIGRILVGGTTLAVAVLVVFVGFVAVRGGSDAAIRGPSGSESLVAYAPLGEVGHLPLRFTWGATSSAAVYRLTVFDPSGATLWTTSLRDTSVALPPDHGLAAGTTYTWIVDALRADGSERTTGIRQFQFRQ
jgi:hypothetical protein